MIKNLIGYLSGNSLSQIILLLTIPLLVSLYSVENFGVFGVFGAYLAIFSQINGLKFENTIISNKRIRVSYYYASCIFISVIVSVTVFLILIIYYDWMYTLLIVLSSFFAYIINTYQLYLVKIEKSILAGYISVLRSVLLVLFQILFSDYKVTEINGLILGCFISLFVLSFPIIFWSIWLVSKIRFVLLLKMIKSNFEFVRYILPQTLINNISVQMPVFFIESIWGLHAVGIYTMALKIVQVPSRFMSTVLRNLLTSAFSNISSSISLCYSKAKSYTLYLAILSFCFFSALAIFIPFIIEVFLGDEWSDVVLISRCMLIWFSVSFINIPAFCLTMVYRKLKFILNFEIVSFIIRLALFFCFYLIPVEFYIGMLVISLSVAVLNFYFIFTVLCDRGKVF
ncbi:oligosaccharide flippase family protein [Shewanella vesiculosa]|uniref:Oligosaccharide flippase family protein n=1 Tax=Shewanella vesiculosa TaxID=518738 RepID=A0ABV0FPP3_9GAMM